MKRTLCILGTLCFILYGFNVLKEYTLKIPPGWPQPVYNIDKNPLSDPKIQLGRVLFYDPILSKNNTISCASCHSPFNAFAHVDHNLSHGIDDKIGTRNAPAIMNLAWHKNFMWDGAVNHLDVQALAPITNPLEMDEKIDHVVQKLRHSPIYPKLFFIAWGDSTITGEHLLKSIAQFQLTLISNNSKYDSVMRKESSFTVQEANGYALFKKQCNSCHAEPLFTNFEFMNNGLPVDTTLNDRGRWNITHNANDSLKFKVPTLRNIEFSYPYMHDGRFKKLADVFNHYTKGIVKNPTLAAELQNSLLLSANDKVDLMAFLLTLSDRDFIFNKEFSYPKNIFSGGAKDIK